MDPREEHVYMAKLAEQAERYDEMVEHVSKTYVHNIYIYTHTYYMLFQLTDIYIYILLLRFSSRRQQRFQFIIYIYRMIRYNIIYIKIYIYVTKQL